MIEIVFLTMMNRLVGWGLAPIIATRTVAADAPMLQRLLSDPVNQLRLASGSMGVTARRSGDTCEARLKPRALPSVPVSMVVRPSSSRRLSRGELRIGRQTVAWLTWILSSDRGTTEVDLAVQLESRSLAARMLLLLGGRRRISRRLDDTLSRLATACAYVAEHDRSAATAPRAGAGAPHRRRAADRPAQERFLRRT